MCYSIVERYSVCRHVYQRHGIDPCHYYGKRGHIVQEKIIHVGYSCLYCSQVTSALAQQDIEEIREYQKGQQDDQRKNKTNGVEECMFISSTIS